MEPFAFLCVIWCSSYLSIAVWVIRRFDYRASIEVERMAIIERLSATLSVALHTLSAAMHIFLLVIYGDVYGLPSSPNLHQTSTAATLSNIHTGLSVLYGMVILTGKLSVLASLYIPARPNRMLMQVWGVCMVLLFPDCIAYVYPRPISTKPCPEACESHCSSWSVVVLSYPDERRLRCARDCVSQCADSLGDDSEQDMSRRYPLLLVMWTLPARHHPPPQP